MTDIEISTPAPAAAGAGAAPAPAPAESVEALAGSPFVTVYAVHGMSCGHCASAVTRELTALGGVDGVHVDLESKKVTVGSARRLSDEEVREAVDEAGYELV
jgi:copper chaperone CopZ